MNDSSDCSTLRHPALVTVICEQSTIPGQCLNRTLRDVENNWFTELDKPLVIASHDENFSVAHRAQYALRPRPKHPSIRLDGIPLG